MWICACWGFHMNLFLFTSLNTQGCVLNRNMTVFSRNLTVLLSLFLRELLRIVFFLLFNVINWDLL